MSCRPRKVLLDSFATRVRATGMQRRTLTSRAIAFHESGNADEVLKLVRYPIPSLGPQDVLVRHELSSLNPSDLNVIEGTYNIKPPKRDLDPGKDTFICGSEGVCYVQDIGKDVKDLRIGQQLIMRAKQMGTWQTHQVLSQEAVVASPPELSSVQACTIMSNPTTAYRMLKDYVELGKGEYVIQNGSNSAVGQAIIQLAKAMGHKTINLVRDRPNQNQTDEMKAWLKSLGADYVITHSEAHDRSFKKFVMGDLTQGKGVRLGLNCVSGPDTVPLTSVLAESGHLVTYGALSKKPLTFSNGWFIFKNGRASGFNLGRWEASVSKEERDAMIAELAGYVRQGKLRPSAHRIVDLSSLTDKEMLHKVQEAIREQYGGYKNKKTLFKLS